MSLHIESRNGIYNTIQGIEAFATQFGGACLMVVHLASNSHMRYVKNLLVRDFYRGRNELRGLRKTVLYPDMT